MAEEFSSDVQFIRDFLLALFDGSCTSNFSNDRFSDELQPIFPHLPPIYDSGQLAKALPSPEKLSGRLLDSGCVLFLKFVEKERAWPVIDMRWDFDSDSAHRWQLIRFRFQLLRRHADGSEPSAVGFRLEPPENYWQTSEESGIHSYWHAQMILELEKDDDIFSKITRSPRGWLPVHQPAFPLPAESAGDLLAILLVSIYGTEQLPQLVREAKLLGELRNRLTKMGIPLP